MAVFDSPSWDAHELVAFREDPHSGLRAIIAVHNTHFGPALGGCRMYPYASDQEALEDVLRLSRGMTYKSALAGLPLGGGKSVIIGDPRTQKTPELLLAMGEFVESLGGKYITAEDSGTCVADMKIVRRRTGFVSGVLARRRFGGDPSPYTAYGVYLGIKTAVKYRFDRDTVSGLSVALQGVGAVGGHLAERLIRDGATVYAADINAENREKAESLGAIIVDAEDILELDADIFSPCAMGAVLNQNTVERVRAAIVAGAANNQLASPREGERLRQRGILYAPDFVINAGGLIEVYYQREGAASSLSEAHVEKIGGRLQQIFERADRHNTATDRVAEQLAEELLREKPRELHPRNDVDPVAAQKNGSSEKFVG